MKEKFEQMIMRLFTVVPWYVSNFDDTYEGFEFNPTSRDMIQVKFSFESKNGRL